MQTVKFLSLIVPAFRQEKTIVKDISNLDLVLSSLPCKHEILVIVDGFVDETYELVKKIENGNIKVFGYEKNQGKGYAVRYGILKGKGDIVGFIDAGMDISASGIPILLDSMLWNDADIIVASKLHPDSKVNYPTMRRIFTWGYRSLTHILFGFNIKDTQTGLKFFKKDVVRDVFPKLLVKTFAFDVEILAVAYSLGYSKIYEGPVQLNFNKASTIDQKTFWKIIAFMLWDTFAVFYRLRILNFYKRKLK